MWKYNDMITFGSSVPVMYAFRGVECGPENYKHIHTHTHRHTHTPSMSLREAVDAAEYRVGMVMV